jgi:type IV pilus assembly protein PilA
MEDLYMIRIKRFMKQIGQGMTEYIIIVALIAIAAIAAYSFFGDTVRLQVGNMAAELGGGEGDAAAAKAAGEQSKTKSEKASRLGDYTGQNQ